MRHLENRLREVEFWLKSRLTYSFPVFKIQKAKPDKWRAELDAAGRARLGELDDRYDLSAWPTVCSPAEFVGNCCFLDILDRVFGDRQLPRSGLDVGSRSFWYAPALRSFHAGPWTGVEVDAHQRYLTGSTRKGYAQYMASPWEDVHYQTGCLTEINQPFGLITWFLPYVVAEPMEASGLPNRFFDPPKLLRHALTLLGSGASLFIINQGEEEACIQEGLFKKLGVTYRALGEVDSVFSVYRKKRFGFLVHENENATLKERWRSEHKHVGTS